MLPPDLRLLLLTALPARGFQVGGGEGVVRAVASAGRGQRRGVAGAGQG